MGQWAFFRFALSIAAIMAATILGYAYGKTAEKERTTSDIILYIEDNNDADQEIRKGFNFTKSGIVKRLQEHIRD